MGVLMQFSSYLAVWNVKADDLANLKTANLFTRRGLSLLNL